MFNYRWVFPRFQLSWIGGAIAGGLGLVGSIAGGVMAGDAQDDANKANSAESARNREFQREMSNTGYQRAVKDLRAANLNPMLAYSHGPASTPSGAQAVMQPKYTPSSFGSAGSAAAAGVQMNQAIAQTANVKADTANKLAQAGQIIAQTRFLNAQANTEGYRPQLVTSQAQQAKSSSRSIDEMLFPLMDKARADTALSRTSAEEIRQRNFMMKKLLENPNTSDSILPYIWDYFRSK